jgi:hypothetical protein
MTAINPTTCRRLQQLPQIPSVWEGDRRQLDRLAEDLDLDDEEHRELIVWIDGVEGVVRAMEVVNSSMGNEAIVRALIKAMEYPQSPAQPARPQKIIVRDREIQFYLRGVLHDLEITVDYVPELPIIDELFERFNEMAGSRPPKLPRKYLELLKNTAREIWELAPWRILADYEIISIELNQWDVEKFYVSVMGMLGMEYGVLLYRSIESLERFRAMALQQEGMKDMESAFLAQDCIFVTFDSESSDRDPELGHFPMSAMPPSDSHAIESNFGNIHPLEGMRPFLYEEEAIATHVALCAFKRFVEAFRHQLEDEELPSLHKRFRIPLPDGKTTKQIEVATVPELSQQLLQMHLALEEDGEFSGLEVPIREDLIPNDSFISLGMMPWDRVDMIRQVARHHQDSAVQPAGEGLPIVLIQTTRPRAQEIIQHIQDAGGLYGIGFNPGEDTLSGDSYDLGILRLADGEMQLFGEFYNDSPVHIEARKKWNQRSKTTSGYCGLIVAHGLTGKARGNPGLREMIAFFETRSLSDSDFGLGTLQLMPDFD